MQKLTKLAALTAILGLVPLASASTLTLSLYSSEIGGGPTAAEELDATI